MKTALVFGSSGLIGGHILQKLIHNNNYHKIKVFVRSDPKIDDPKLEIIRTDFNNLKKAMLRIKSFCEGLNK